MDEDQQRPGRNRPRGRARAATWVSAVVGLAVVGTVVVGLTGSDDTAEPDDRDRRPGATSSAPSTAPAGDGTGGTASWLSGSAGASAVDGEFARWRGSPVEIVGTWADDNEAMRYLWTLQPGGELADYRGPLDIAVGAIGPDETWAEAAEGAYDARWRESLTELARLRADAGTTYIRFAHEMNGDWYPWSVGASDAEDFMTAWKRYRDLQLEIFPAAQLVFNANRESVGTGIDWRTTFPGAEHVDLYSVDYYNHYPWVNTTADWEASLTETDQYGAPKGLEAHRRFAAEMGLPFAISEWSNNADFGDAPVFMAELHEYLRTHGGDGPGEVVYEILFNIDQDDSAWVLHPVGRMPEASEAYRELW